MINIDSNSKNEVKDHLIISYQVFQCLLGLGSLTPRTLSIFAMMVPMGKDFPASHALI